MDITMQELRHLTTDRLFVLQKTLLKQLRYYLNNSLYDKNDIFFTLEQIDVINLAIIKKMKNEKKQN